MKLWIVESTEIESKTTYTISSLQVVYKEGKRQSSMILQIGDSMKQVYKNRKFLVEFMVE